MYVQDRSAVTGLSGSTTARFTPAQSTTIVPGAKRSACLAMVSTHSPGVSATSTTRHWPSSASVNSSSIAPLIRAAVTTSGLMS